MKPLFERGGVCEGGKGDRVVDVAASVVGSPKTTITSATMYWLFHNVGTHDKSTIHGLIPVGVRLADETSLCSSKSPNLPVHNRTMAFRVPFL